MNILEITNKKLKVHPKTLNPYLEITIEIPLETNIQETELYQRLAEEFIQQLKQHPLDHSEVSDTLKTNGQGKQ
jgi:sRNA-binding carbon storage regulator CsrA